MCGRYSLAVPQAALVEAFDVPGLTFEYRPRYNVAPGQSCPVVAEDGRGRRAGLLEWGFLPHWKDEPTAPLINARSESVGSKASFAEAFQRRRCLVPADGFYEWKVEGGSKVPYWIHPTDALFIAFAGIWETWSRPGAEPRHTFAILTTEANEEVSVVHHRMPVVIAPQDRDAWLARGTHAGRLRGMLGPAPAGSFRMHPVSARVNRPAEDDPGLVDPVDSR